MKIDWQSSTKRSFLYFLWQKSLISPIMHLLIYPFFLSLHRPSTHLCLFLSPIRSTSPRLWSSNQGIRCEALLRLLTFMDRDDLIEWVHRRFQMTNLFFSVKISTYVGAFIKACWGGNKAPLNVLIKIIILRMHVTLIYGHTVYAFCQ